MARKTARVADPLGNLSLNPNTKKKPKPKLGTAFSTTKSGRRKKGVV